MKILGLIFMLFVSMKAFSQVNDDFSDGNFTENPVWTGKTENFVVNDQHWLQSNAAGTSQSWLFTPSVALENAVWQCRIHIDYTTSSSNYAAVYLLTDSDNLTNGCNAYYVQVGGTADEVSLYLQQGTRKTKLIDGIDARTNGNPVDIDIKVTRDEKGTFTLYSRNAGEADYTTEGRATDTALESGSYFGVFYANTSTTGKKYSFSDIKVSGSPKKDTSSPVLTAYSLTGRNKLRLDFSEGVSLAHAAYMLSGQKVKPASQNLSDDARRVELIFDRDFEQNTVYTLCMRQVEDESGNQMSDTCITFNYAVRPRPGDLVINEIMSNNPVHSAEYVELYNTTENILSVSAIRLAVKRTDGSFSDVAVLPVGMQMMPHGYAALTAFPDSVRNYHQCPDSAVIIKTEWSNLNNESGVIALLSAAGDTICDQVEYSQNWHSKLIKDSRGVALEKINPNLPSAQAGSWHSASTETRYGTPGYQNSQYRALEAEKDFDSYFKLDPQAFSPDNDGIDDVCFIRYKMDAPGYVASVGIFDTGGRKIAQPANAMLLSTEGFISWDGVTQSGKNVNPGIYIVYIEIFNAENGVKKQFKKPVVVSIR